MPNIELALLELGVLVQRTRVGTPLGIKCAHAHLAVAVRYADRRALGALGEDWATEAQV